MTYDEKRAWLWRYQDSLRMQRELELEVERLRSEAERITPLLSGMPHGGGEDSLPRAVEAIIRAQQQLECQVNCGKATRACIVTVINTVPDARRHEILRRRYLLGQRFDDIADAMHMDSRWVRRLHKYTLINLQIDPVKPSGHVV